MTSKKESGKAEAVKEAEAPKTVKAVEKETAPKAAASKTAAKAPAKKPAAKKVEPKASVVIEFGGKQIVAKDVLAAAKKDFTKKHDGTELKSISLYIKPEESVAYYVANNGVGDPEDKVEF